MIEIKKKLMNRPDKIERILYKYGFHNVSVGTSEIRCAFDKTGNHTSIRIKLNENLTTNDFARDMFGDLISFIMKSKDIEFKDILQTIKDELGVTSINFNKPKAIFGGFYDKIKLRNKNTYEMKIYEESVLDEYLNKFNTLFLKDGIDFNTQRKFKIGVCQETSRITVPWYNSGGELVGIEGRYMGDYEKDELAKWFPIVAFPKSQFLFGYHTNYKHLQSCEVVYVGESSKFVMQLNGMGIKTAVALGGNAIHNEQIKQLNWLNPKAIVLCLDEGLEEEFIKKQVDKIKLMLKFTSVKVGYVFDKDKKIMKDGSKCSPSDLGKDCFDELIKNNIEWGN